MIIKDPYVGGVSNSQVKDFFDTSLRHFDDELELLFQKTKWAKNSLFEYNERAFVGLFNNAIVRQGGEYRTLQEYHVYKRDEQFIGRADLLIMHDDFSLLVEAKKWTYDGIEYRNIDSMMVEPGKQVWSYYKAEEGYFKKGQTYVGILIFEYVAENYLTDIKRKYTSAEESEEGIHFDALYASEKSGLMVYGQVFKPDMMNR